MRETEGTGAHTHTQQKEREGGVWGGLTAIHRLHFGHVPCPGGAVLARALPVRDILTSVRGVEPSVGPKTVVVGFPRVVVECLLALAELASGEAKRRAKPRCRPRQRTPAAPSSLKARPAARAISESS